MNEPTAIIGGMHAPPSDPPPVVKFYREEGVIQSGEFEGWEYRIQTDRRGVRWTLSDGSVLILMWPALEHRPLPCRWAYVPITMLEPA